MISDALSLIEFLREHYREYRVLSGLFDCQGKRVEGSKKLSINKIVYDPNREDVWFYEVVGPKDLLKE